jgi:uroporphyrinogen-III decarboxylase
MTKYEWIKAVLNGNKDVPVPQHWMSFFNGAVAKKLSPKECHYTPMWMYEAPEHFDMTAMGPDELDKMIQFNNYTGRCFSCLGKGANISWGHGGPGEFFCKLISRSENELIAEYETGVRAKVQFNPHFYHNYDHPVKTLDDLNNLQLPDPNDPQRYIGFTEDVRYLKSKGEYVVGSLNGFFSGIHYFLMEYTETLMALIDNQELIVALLDRLGEWNITAAKKMIQCGADCVCLCDDLGSKTSLLMAPSLYREFFKPWHKRLCDEIHALGGDVHLHSHGAITKILDDLVECGFDFINPFDPEEKNDINLLMEKYSSHFVIVGGFPASFWEWENQDQEDYLKRIADLGKKHGRLIFMDSGGIPENVSPEDFDRVSQISRKVRGVEDHPGLI